MLYREIARMLGAYLFILAAVLLIPLSLAFYYEYFLPSDLHLEPHTTNSFLYSSLISLSLGFLLYFLGKGASGQLFRREAIAAVVLIWFITGAIGALPFWLSGTLENPAAAYFESVSGLTTTGATAMTAKKFNLETGKEEKIVSKVGGVKETVYEYFGTISPVRDPKTHLIIKEGVEAVSKAILFWRSMLQWLGGGGIIVLFVAILPALGVGGRVLFQMEVAGPIKDSLTPRIKETAMQLWKIYIFFTVLQVLTLMAVDEKMQWLDAITITFSSLSTGGFSIRNDNIAYYQNASVEWVVIVFMVIGSINFSLYYQAMKGRLYKFFDPEFLLYMAVLGCLISFSTYLLYGTPLANLGVENNGNYDFIESLRFAAFQGVSSITSTGFFTANYDLWPFALQAILLLVMYIGAMSGSTAGGIKIIRHLIVFKASQDRVESLFNPEVVKLYRVGNRAIDPSIVNTVMCFLAIVISTSVLTTLAYILDGIDLETSFGLVACMVNNTGLAFRAAGPLGSCAFFSDFGYTLSSVLMIMGRLEYFAVLALLVPAFWRSDAL